MSRNKRSTGNQLTRNKLWLYLTSFEGADSNKWAWCDDLQCFYYYYFLYKSVSINNVFLHQGFMRSNDYLWVAILEASRVWGYQDGAPCLGYICRTIQNNVIIFRCIYDQSLFYHKRHSTLLYNNRIEVSLRVNTNTAILPTRTQASSFTRTHCHKHAVSHARTSTRTHFHTHAGTLPPLFSS